MEIRSKKKSRWLKKIVATLIFSILLIAYNLSYVRSSSNPITANYVSQARWLSNGNYGYYIDFTDTTPPFSEYDTAWWLKFSCGISSVNSNSILSLLKESIDNPSDSDSHLSRIERIYLYTESAKCLSKAASKSFVTSELSKLERGNGYSSDINQSEDPGSTSTALLIKRNLGLNNYKTKDIEDNLLKEFYSENDLSKKVAFASSYKALSGSPIPSPLSSHLKTELEKVYAGNSVTASTALEAASSTGISLSSSVKKYFCTSMSSSYREESGSYYFLPSTDPHIAYVYKQAQCPHFESIVPPPHAYDWGWPSQDSFTNITVDSFFGTRLSQNGTQNCAQYMKYLEMYGGVKRTGSGYSDNDIIYEEASFCKESKLVNEFKPKNLVSRQPQYASYLLSLSDGSEIFKNEPVQATNSFWDVVSYAKYYSATKNVKYLEKIKKYENSLRLNSCYQPTEKSYSLDQVLSEQAILMWVQKEISSPAICDSRSSRISMRNDGLHIDNSKDGHYSLLDIFFYKFTKNPSALFPSPI